jgi:hypothetical protein
MDSLSAALAQTTTRKSRHREEFKSFDQKLILKWDDKKLAD